MPPSGETIAIHVTVDIAVSSLKAIVENAKKIHGTDEKGVYRIDTAQTVNDMVSAFLTHYGFDDYVNNLDNYSR